MTEIRDILSLKQQQIAVNALLAIAVEKIPGSSGRAQALRECARGALFDLGISWSRFPEMVEKLPPGCVLPPEDKLLGTKHKDAVA